MKAIKKRKIQLKNGEILDIEIILDPTETFADKKEIIVKEMRNITSKCWADFRDVTFKWFDLADILLIVKKGERIVAFSTSKFMEGDLIVFLSTMVLPEFQSMNIAKTLQKITIKNFLIKNFRIIHFKLWKHFKNLYFSYRTSNPRLIKAVKRYNLALPINGCKPTLEEINIAKKVAKMFSPDCRFNSDSFVIEGAFKDNSDLIYEQEEIPWSNDEKIDKFCEEYLGYKEKKGNLFVVVGHLSFWQKLLIFFS